MTVLINKRNAKFRSAVSDLLIACSSHNPPLDPIELLLEATEENLPVHPDELLTEDDKRSRGAKERREELEFLQRNPDLRPSIRSIIEHMMGDEDMYRNQIVPNGHRTLEARDAVYGAPSSSGGTRLTLADRCVTGELNHALSDALTNALLATKRIQPGQLYSHQAAAVNALHPSDEHPYGQHVIVSTSTSSGKSLIYQLPVVQALEEDPDATALYVFPTKALAQDQKRSLGELVSGVDGLEGVKIATFDGDTPRDDRNYIREHVNVVRACAPSETRTLPDLRWPDLHEPGHAAHHNSSARRALAPLLSQASLRCCRRTAYLLGPVRLPRCLRHAPVRPVC